MLVVLDTIGAPIKGHDSNFGIGEGMIVLDNVVCDGDEQNLFHCEHNDFFNNNCDHTEDAAVICGGKLRKY